MTALRRNARPVVGAVALYALAAIFSIWHLRQLESPPLDGLFAWGGIAAVPAVLAVLPGRGRAGTRYAILCVPTVIFAIGTATGHWPFRPHLLGASGYLALVGSAIHDGLDRWVHTVLPYDPGRYPELRVIVLLGVFFIFASLAAAIIVFRAAFAAIVIAFIPFLVVSTVYRLGSQTERSAMMLALALAFLGGLTPRTRRSGQLSIGGAVLVAGISLAALPGVAKGEFIDWKHWGREIPKGASVEYVWNQTYGPLNRPLKPVTLLRISSNGPRTYWRTIVLDRFDNRGWFERSPLLPAVAPSPVKVPAEALPSAWVDAGTSPWVDAGATPFQVQVRNVGLRTDWLVAPAVATEVVGLPGTVERVQPTMSGTFRLARTLPIGSRYLVRYVPPSATVKDLQSVAFHATDPASMQVFDPPLTVYPWGTPGREALVRADLEANLFDPSTTRWKEAYTKAQGIVRGARTPYTAVIALEHYFQENGVYSDQADLSRAPDPLPTFFLQDNPTGYCQMFSGTMTVLLRMLGIPARVVEGFTEGRRDEKTNDLVITDRAAHAWVEVYFDGYGWLPFEPTPSRSIAAAYSTTSTRFQEAKGSGLTGAALPPALATYLRSLRSGSADGRASDRFLNPRHNPNVPSTTDGTSPKDRPFHLSFIASVALIVAGVVLLILLVKGLRRLPQYVRRDPQVVARAVRADLEAYVRDQGLSGDVRALTAEEFARVLRREFGVDAREWAAQMARARYGPRDGRAAVAADRARREARLVRRDLRRELSVGDRARGAVRIRSLLP